jgi:hypothetical protein
MISFPNALFPLIMKLKTHASGGSIPLANTETGKGNSTNAGTSAIKKSRRLLVFPETGWYKIVRTDMSFVWRH